MGKINEAAIVANLADSEFINVVLSDGTLGKIKKVNLIPYTGSEQTSKRWINEGWHRILIGGTNNLVNSAIVNIANSYGSVRQSYSCFYLGGGGYENRMVSKIGGDGTIFPKVRLLYKSSTSSIFYVDILYNTSTNNYVMIAISNALGIHLSDMNDTIVDIPEGYSVQEFELK